MKNGNTIKNRKFLQKGIYGLILPIIFIFVISMYESEVIYIYSDYALGETIGYSIFPIFSKNSLCSRRIFSCSKEASFCNFKSRIAFA